VPELRDHEPTRATMLEEVLAGLRQEPKSLPCKYLYDARGSRLFDRICELPEYYPTRTELAIMERHADEMAALLGPHCLLIEYGSGSSTETELLLTQLEAPAGYAPVDISREHLAATATRLDARYPDLEVLPVCADFTEPFELTAPRRPAQRRCVYFPGSTIGNFTRREAVDFLAGTARQAGKGGALLIGVDLDKDAAILEPAYDDAEGVTAEFNKNLLRRLNRELDADFDLERFHHRAVYAPVHKRVEMHLVSDADQRVRIDGETIGFRAGEIIVTEHSHKYTLADFRDLARQAGFEQERVWTDPHRLLSRENAICRPAADTTEQYPE